MEEIEPLVLEKLEFGEPTSSQREPFFFNMGVPSLQRREKINDFPTEGQQRKRSCFPRKKN